MRKIALLILSSLLLVSLVSAVQICEVYDDFSSGALNSEKWEVRQDVEGWPFTEEYWVDADLENYHTQQNTIGDRRVYLVPKHTFTTGNILEYDFNIVSHEGNYMQMDLLTGDQYIRVGIMGYINGVQGYDELGVSHIKVEFQENNLHLERTTPSNVTLIDNLALSTSNRNYQFYIGSISGNNGRMHIDFDNFRLCYEQSLEDRIAVLEEKVDELENRTSWLEALINKIVEFIKNLPKGLAKIWVG